jgi:hypothetical protein
MLTTNLRRRLVADVPPWRAAAPSLDTLHVQSSTYVVDRDPQGTVVEPGLTVPVPEPWSFEHRAFREPVIADFWVTETHVPFLKFLRKALGDTYFAVHGRVRDKRIWDGFISPAFLLFLRALIATVGNVHSLTNSCSRRYGYTTAGDIHPFGAGRGAERLAEGIGGWWSTFKNSAGEKIWLNLIFLLNCG